MKNCDHDSRPIYERLIGPIRERAMELGYAIGVHGSLKRDIDLIACPWTAGAVDAVTLAQAIREVAAAHNDGLAFMKAIEDADDYHRAGRPGAKPHGRLTWCFHLTGGPYIDLSVMPRLPEVYAPSTLDGATMIAPTRFVSMPSTGIE